MANKGDENYTAEEEQTIAPLIDILLSVGATWEQVRMELFRVASSRDSKFSRVPSQSTLERMLLSHFGCSNLTEYKEKGKDNIKIALKGKAVNMALSGNVAMLIFCLKNLCGWQDNVQPVPLPDDAKNQIRLAYDQKTV